MHDRAYSVLTIKSLDADARVIRGTATTPAVDHAGDIVEPEGAQFELPMPLLRHHDPEAPIGHVTRAKVSSDGIEIEAQIATIDEPGALKDRVDLAWQELKAGLVRGLSIGFKPVEAARIEGTFGFRFLKWKWLELSTVTIPANAEATAHTIKSIGEALRQAMPQPVHERAAAIRTSARVVRLNPAAPRPFVIQSIKR
jgi:HK97 family phage prohead protease